MQTKLYGGGGCEDSAAPAATYLIYRQRKLRGNSLIVSFAICPSTFIFHHVIVLKRAAVCVQ